MTQMQADFDNVGQVVALQRRTVIAYEGQRHIIKLVSGLLHRVCTTEHDDTSVAFYVAGDYLLLTKDDTPLEALRQCVAVSVPVIAADDTSIVPAVMYEQQAFALNMLEQLRRTETLRGVFERTGAEATDRLAWLLKFLGYIPDLAEMTPDGPLISLSHPDLGALVNMRRETVSRALSLLRSRGVLTYTRNSGVVMLQHPRAA